MNASFLDTLAGEDHGQFSVQTISGSTYLIDLDAGTVRRRAGLPDPHWTAGTANMRLDGVDVELIACVCDVGSPAEFLVDLHLPTGYLTTRYSTMVLSIIAADREHRDAA